MAHWVIDMTMLTYDNLTKEIGKLNEAIKKNNESIDEIKEILTRIEGDIVGVRNNF